MVSSHYKRYDRFISKKTTGRNDVTPVFSEPALFGDLISDLIRPFKDASFDKIVCLDSLGFILGGAIALRLKKGLVVVRKGGKLPYDEKFLVREGFTDYTNQKKSFEMHKDSIKKGEGVLIVDEWIETGAQIKATIKLVERLGGVVVGIAAINADKRPETEILFKKYNCKALNTHIGGR